MGIQKQALLKQTDSAVVAYELDIDELVPYVNPRDYGIKDFVAVKPHSYFVTSGDAVVKATHLHKDMQKSVGEARKGFGKSVRKKHKEFLVALATSVRKCKAFLDMLVDVRGTHIFLELEWKDHKLYCIPKDPRKKDQDDSAD